MNPIETSGALEETLYHAALLSGMGARAATVARAAAGVAAARVDGRSCLEAGGRVQLTLDAPGRAQLRFGLHLDGPPAEALGRARSLVGEADAATLAAAVARLGPTAFPPAASLGAWLFWCGDRAAAPPTPSPPGWCGTTSARAADGPIRPRASLFLDARDGSPRVAAERVRPLLDGAGGERLDRALGMLECAQPWALRLESVGGRLSRVHLHWLLRRDRDPRALASALGAAAEWEAAGAAFATLLRCAPGARTGPWVVATPLDGESAPGLRIATSAWSRLGDDQRKLDDLASAVARLGGARDHAEALWSLLVSAIPPQVRWRVGRAVEARALTDGSLRLRLFLVPRC
jgi:hypothetical protein